jgi:hypothetical protein
MYFNGVEQADTGTNPSANEPQQFMVNGHLLALGALANRASVLNGKMTFIQVIDGLQLAPTDVGQSDGGIWKHKKYTGSFGTNGWYFAGTNGFISELGLGGTAFTNNNGVTLDTADVPPFVTV